MTQLNTADNVYIGSDAASTVYLGSTQVWARDYSNPEELTNRATYYVDSVAGSNSNNGTTASTPKQTLAGLPALIDGDVIALKRGSVFVAGLDLTANAITIGAYGTGAQPQLGSGQNIGIQWSGNDVIVQDITVTGWLRRGLHNQGGDRPIIQRCTISGGDGTAGVANHSIRMHDNGGSYIEGPIIRFCSFGTMCAGTAATAAQRQGIFFVALLLQDCNNVLVEDNTFATTNTVACWLSIGDTAASHASGGTLRRNEINNCTAGILVHYSDNVTIGGWGQGNHVHDGYGCGASAAFGSLNSDIIGNHIHDLTRVTGDALWNGIDVSGGATGRVLFNTVYKVVRHCVVLAADNGGAGDWTVAFNILDASNNTAYTVSDYRRLCVADRTGQNNLTEHHNILYAYDHTASNLVTNPTFATYSGTADDGVADTFTGWTLNTNVSGRIEAITEVDSHLAGEPSGTTGMALIPGPAGVMQARSTAIALTAGVIYTVKVRGAWEQVSATPGDCGVRLSRNGTMYCQDDGVTWSATVNQVIDMTNSALTEYEFAFTPDVTTNYTVHLFPNFVRGNTYTTSIGVYAGEALIGRLVASNGIDQGTCYTLAAWQGAGFGSNSLDAAPLLDINGIPQAGSPAIDAGQPVSGVTGTYSGAAPDLGSAEI